MADPRAVHRRELLALVVGALCVRLVGRGAYRYVDMDVRSYLDLARNLVGGEGIEGLFYWPPLFPVLVALLASLGIPIEMAATGLVVAAGTLLVVPVFMLGSALGGVRAGRWAGLGAGLLPSLVLAGQRDHAEPLALLAIGFVAVCLVQARTVGQVVKGWSAVGCGACLALACLARFEWWLAVPGVLWMVGGWGPGRTGR
ncbi:MAG: hypothetical protein QGG40_04105, partial [Myxococcota bacterium]|nr:hypothetical protein [Myxococcota bacterium]